MSADNRTHPLRLVFAGVQPILAGWAIIAVLGIFAYTLMADSPALGSTTWQDVASVTTGWWLTAFGGTLHFDGVSISLPPLLITLLTYAAAVAFIRRLPIKDWVDTTIVAASSGAATALLGLLAPIGTGWWPAGIGGAIISLLAVLSSKNRVDWFARGFFTSAAGRALYDGFMLARRAMMLALILALAAVAASVIAGWSEVLKINGYYIVEWHSNVMMWLFQLAYLPTWVLWALAYIVGAGFSVGAGTVFSALGVTSAPLPAIPMLGALPQPGAGAAWIVAVTVLCLLLLGVWQARSFPVLSEVLMTGSIQVGVIALLGSILAVVSQGAIGPDRLAVTGAEAPRMALACALVIGVPLLLGMILGHRTSVAKYREWARTAKARASELRRRRSTGDDQLSQGADSSAAPGARPAQVMDNGEVDGGAGGESMPQSPTAATAQTAPEATEDR